MTEARRSSDLDGERWDLISGVVVRPLLERISTGASSTVCVVEALEAIDGFLGCTAIDPDQRDHYLEKALGLVADAIQDDEGRGVEALPFAALRRLARTCHEGAERYGLHNWLHGFPVWSLLNHAKRHLILWLAADKGDDHLAHAMWGLMASIHFWKYRPDLCTGLAGRDYSFPRDQ